MTQFTVEGSAPVIMAATVSDCGRYRYELRRVWDGNKRLLVVCMLNPSTADAQKDDPTIRELTYFAKLWGYGGLLIVNLYAFRASQPREMMAQDRNIIVGPKNGEFIEAAFAFARHQNTRILAAWGNDGAFGDREEVFIARAQKHTVSLICLGKTKGGFPKHPMSRGINRIPRDQQPIMFRSAMELA